MAISFGNLRLRRAMQALRILDNACDACLEHPDTFKLWEILEK